jgi:signal transduction histidine kinase
VYVVPLLLERVLDNLLTNASKYTERGSILVEVTGQPGWLVIKISDSGRGIATERLEQVFRGGEPDPAPVVGSSRGVGLSTVVRLLAQMGGRLEIMSVPRQGTTIWVYVPVRASLETSVPDREPASDVVARIVKIRPRSS